MAKTKDKLKDSRKAKIGKGAGFELGRSEECSGESWVSRRSDRKSGEKQGEVGGKSGITRLVLVRMKVLKIGRNSP
nr:hypothetical protein [Tanacetum cinerariifolium]